MTDSTFEKGDKVISTYVKSGKEVRRKGIFVRLVKGPYSSPDLCMVHFQACKVPTYALVSQLTKLA